MYLRNLINFDKNTTVKERRNGRAGTFLFALILIIALLASSLTERESTAIESSNLLYLAKTRDRFSGASDSAGMAKFVSNGAASLFELATVINQKAYFSCLFKRLVSVV